MTKSQEKLQTAMKFALANRPKVCGFPFLAECLKQAGVKRNIWSLPGAQSIYIMEESAVVQQGPPLVKAIADVPVFNKVELIGAIRKDRSGGSTFPEFLSAAWQAGVTGYEVNFDDHTVSYYGVLGERFTETYPAIEIHNLKF